MKKTTELLMPTYVNKGETWKSFEGVLVMRL